jgi:hypothetical protein
VTFGAPNTLGRRTLLCETEIPYSSGEDLAELPEDLTEVGIRRVFEQVALHSQRVIERYVTAGLISEIPPTCGAPISHALTSQAPTYRAPTSEAPTSKVPTSRAPISLASSSQMPTCRALAELSEIEVEQDGRRDQSAAGVARTPTRRSSGLTPRNCGA